MGIRRSITLYRVYSGDVSLPPDPAAELVALGISVLMVLGVFFIGPLFKNIRRTHDALSESEKQFRGVFEHAGAGIAKTTLDGHFLLVNDRFLEIVGFDRDALLSVSFADITHPQDRESDISGIGDLLAGRRQTYDPQKRYIRANGDVVWADLTIVVVRDRDGAPDYLLAVIEDITERKRAKMALTESQARLTEIIDIAPEAVITVGGDMSIQLFNQGAERVFGYTADEVLGRPLGMLMPERFREAHKEHIEEFERSRDTYRLMERRDEIIGIRKDGTEFPASASISKLEIGREKVFTVMLQDATERKRIEHDRLQALLEAKQANQAKSAFLAAMSHELRTPLNAILGFADILSTQSLKPLGEKKSVEYAKDIHASGEHLLSLVNDLLDISTIEAGKRSLTKEKLALEELVAESVNIVAENARDKGIELVIISPEKLPTLYADKRAIRQVLLNLLSNALKFTPEGGKITVSLQASKNKAMFRIADTGKGIPPESLSDLTNPFVRLERDPHKTAEGWGLGLAITKSLVDLHGGKLDIESKPGKGTTVSVMLPNHAP